MRDNEVEFCTNLSLNTIDLLGLQKQLTAPMRVEFRGKYTRWEVYTYYFGTNDIGIYVEESYHDDDGQNGKTPTVIIYKARDVINLLENINAEERLIVFAISVI